MTYQALIPQVAAAYGINFDSVGFPQKGYRNESYKLTLFSGEEINLIIHKSEPGALQRIESADRAAAVLDHSHLPVRTRLDKRILKISDGKKEIYAGMYSYLPGATIPWEAYTKSHIKLLGWAMSDMHAMWRGSGASLPIRVDEEVSSLCERMKHYFATPGVQQAMQEKIGLRIEADFIRYQRLFEKLRDSSISCEHILHMDLVRGNVLFDHAKSSDIWYIDELSISGVIDFEKAAVGHPVFDIARTLAFLLVDCANKDRRSIFKYFLQSGYNKRGMNSFKQSDTIGGMPAPQVLNKLIGFFLLHDFYKFLKHTPYESLENNHHFVRTRDILIDYGMIRLDKD